MLSGDIEEKEGHLQLAVANERISQPLACGDVLLFVCNLLHAVPPAARVQDRYTLNIFFNNES